MSTERLFIALSPPDAILEELFRYAARLAADLPNGTVRAMREESLHITLHFLGDVDRSRIEELRRLLLSAVQVQGVSRVHLETEDVGFFPSERRPRVVQLRIAKPESLTRLHESVGRALDDQGFRVEKRAYRPHITLARIGRRASNEQIHAIRRWVKDEQPPRAQAFSVNEVRLVASELTPNGSIYTDVAVVALEE